MKILAFIIMCGSFIALFIIIIRYFYLKIKKPDVGKIYKTTDGFLSGNNRVKKPRRVAVIEQRIDDQAVAVAKIYSKKNRSGSAYIDDLVLHPEDHSSLTEDSIVGSSIYISKNDKTGHRPIFTTELTSTDDSISDEELRKIKASAGGNSKKNRKTAKNKLKKWKKHFKK